MTGWFDVSGEREHLHLSKIEIKNEVDDSLHQDPSEIVANSSSDVSSRYPSGSFAQVFWDQQVKASKLNNAKSMRWEPAMIR